MTDEEQRIAIAEVCGKLNDYTRQALEYFKGRDGYPDAILQLARVPDYPNDLSAMNEAARYAAQNVMNADQWEEFGRLIYDAHPTAVIADAHGEHDFHALASLLTDTTARQMAEAFLKALGLWKK